MKKSFLSVVLAICWFGLGVGTLMGMPVDYKIGFVIATFLLAIMNLITAGFFYRESNK